VRLPRPADAVVERLAAEGVLAGVPLSRLYPERPEAEALLLVAATEMNSDADIALLSARLHEALR
jgi:glycine dehydrogenase subunit 1